MNTDLLEFISPQRADPEPAVRPGDASGAHHGHTAPESTAQRPPLGRVRNSKFLDAASLSLIYVMTRPQAHAAAPGDAPEEVTWVVCADPMALDTPSRRLRLALQLRQARAAMGTKASCETRPALGLGDGGIDAGPL